MAQMSKLVVNYGQLIFFFTLIIITRAALVNCVSDGSVIRGRGWEAGILNVGIVVVDCSPAFLAVECEDAANTETKY